MNFIETENSENKNKRLNLDLNMLRRGAKEILFELIDVSTQLNISNDQIKVLKGKLS